MAMNLGRKWDEDYGIMTPSTGNDDNLHYPSTYIESKKDLKLPESGKITFTFKRTEKTEKDRNGKETFCYSLDLTSLDKVKGEEVESASAESVLDALLKEVKGGNADNSDDEY